MLSFLYAAAIVFLFWTPVALFLSGFYRNRYDNPEDALHYLNQDMRSWAPLAVALMGVLLPTSSLVALATIGVAFEGYMLYSDEEGALNRLKHYLGDRDE